MLAMIRVFLTALLLFNSVARSFEDPILHESGNVSLSAYIASDLISFWAILVSYLKREIQLSQSGLIKVILTQYVGLQMSFKIKQLFNFNSQVGIKSFEL